MRKLWDPRGKLQRPVNMPNEPGKPTHAAPTADKRQKWPPASKPLIFSSFLTLFTKINTSNLAHRLHWVFGFVIMSILFKTVTYLVVNLTNFSEFMDFLTPVSVILCRASPIIVS